MSMGPVNPKALAPCPTYFGNVCTGFGNEDQTCMFCGWQRGEHPEESEKTRLFLEDLRAMQSAVEVAKVVSHER